jgi:hypothetical protein
MRTPQWYSLVATGLALLLTAGAAHAQSVAPPMDTGAVNNTVTVTSSTAGTRIPQADAGGAVRLGCRVGVPTTAAGPVCFAFVDANASCATALTNPAAAEPCVNAGNGFEWLLSQYLWRGQVCAILKSGSTAVAVGYNSW